MEIYQNELDINEIQKRWYNDSKNLNCGALITFVGIVRDDDGIQALSFDIYEPLLKKWLQKWQNIAEKDKAKVFFAHSKGDVKVGESSYIAAVLTPQRKVGLRLINEFVEDFKANAPIWKYDVKNGERIYAKNRSQKLSNAGILAKD
ncbi:Molybdopterin synthase catalytic subunit [Campylobacter majalis]|uniref:Molybdopterin synthase catalytic subunit n=1 Tax=Campylobacter majalis TaxID=2790656 RepID=A0ABN7K287_9BACT|nr:molybdenum cofactor biosynthesis protein MoaE [Campylobacter majalis]CAD7286668.1 Molybdopterin synthase catalytic subunit [Campylobacter majalis]